jgi:recombination protein RecA
MRCKANALLEINHSFGQKAYVDWKYENLRDLVSSPPSARRGKGIRIAYRFTTRSLPELTRFYREFYKNGKKIIPADLNLDPLSLAVWFMDDGSKSYRAVYLNTQKFDIGSLERLIKLLKKEHDITARLNGDKRYYRLRITAESVARLDKVIRPYLLPSFRYKMPS